MSRIVATHLDIQTGGEGSIAGAGKQHTAHARVAGETVEDGAEAVEHAADMTDVISTK